MRIVNVGKKLVQDTNSLAQVQKILYLQMPSDSPLKNTEQITWKKLVITLISKLKLSS